MDAHRYRDLLRQARRLTRSAAAAEDLLHDALVVALQSGRDDPAWLAGVLRLQAAQQARAAVRRRRRETAVASAAAVEPIRAMPSDPAWLQRLPPAARRVAVLALHGLTAEEIRWIVGATPAAFRQRLTSIRKTLGTLPQALRAEALALAYLRDPARSADLQFGLVRRALKAALTAGDGLGTHDPDGHLLVLRRGAHTSPPHGN
jgi:DNA-directed RNA polymerase specialized sigma24 family protein